MEVGCIGDSSAKAELKILHFTLVTVKHPQVPEVPMSHKDLSHESRKHVGQASTESQCSPFWSQETSSGKFNEIAGKSKMG